jgi:hypothetical protein
MENVDSIVKSVIYKFINRSTLGKEKYGTDLDRTDLSTSDWITHAQEELMDGILYLEKLKQHRDIKKDVNNSKNTEDDICKIEKEGCHLFPQE